MHLKTIILSLLITLASPAFADETPYVHQIKSLQEIPQNQPPKTLYLFDLDDTVFDSTSMLGSRAWRKYIGEAAKKIDAEHNWHDIFSLALAQQHPIKTVEALTNPLIKELQDQGFVVVGFTARERNLWYSTPHQGVDAITIDQLHSVGVDFDNGSLENHYPDFSKDPVYYQGVFFSNLDTKGDFLTHLYETSTQFPEKIIFIDDKLSQVESVANALTKLGIPYESYYYTATDKKPFNPLIANIQLYYFYLSNAETSLSDAEALEIAHDNSELTSEDYLQKAIELAKAGTVLTY